MKTLNNILNSTIGAFAGIAIGKFLVSYLHCCSNPAEYIFYSAPWYTESLVWAAVSAIVIAVAVIIKLLIRSKIK